jgi:hypothetical protein
MGWHYCAPASPASNLCLYRINYIAYNILPRREAYAREVGEFRNRD